MSDILLKGNLRVLIDGPIKRRDTLLRHLRAVSVNALPAHERLRYLIPQVCAAGVVQRTLFVECDYAKTIRAFSIARLLGKCTVRYWVGSDVSFALEDARIRRMAQRINALTEANVVVAPHLVEELARLGIKAVCLLSPQDNVTVDKVPPFPNDFAVVFYAIPSRRDFYGLPMLLRLAVATPSVRFDVVGDSGQGISAPPNVRFLGVVSDMASVYAKTSVLLRLVPHDGLPRMVLEALGRARPVVYSLPFPHCILASTANEVSAALTSLAGRLQSNLAGRRFVQENYSDNRQALELKAFYEDLCRKRSWF